MTVSLLAEFADPKSLLAALEPVERNGHRVLDAFTPFPVEEITDKLASRRSPVRPAMLASGFGMAAFAYALQVYSAVWSYPYNAGGRPLHSWPVFLLVPFEVGVFAAALAGIIAFFMACGLPRLHQPVFGVPGFERASQDRYFLLARARGEVEGVQALRALLEESGALVVTQVEAP